MTSDISNEFAKGDRSLAKEPTIKKDIYERATVMVQQKFKAFKAKQSNSSSVEIFSVPSSDCENATESFYKTLVRTTWSSFDEFIIYGYQKFYIVTFSLENWKTESMCTCAPFFKQHMCKHIIAIGIRDHAIEIPQTVNPSLLMPTRKKSGRPKLTTKALSKQH